MVDIARQRAAARGLTNVRAEVLDLENIAEPDEAYDVVLCREGMMFALDPARAAAEMHRILRPAGRAAVAVWASRQDNPWLGVLLDTITQVTGIDVPPPGTPGPFALSDTDGLRQLFAGAGFTALTLDHVAAPLRSPSFEAWWTRNLTLAGPAAAILNGLDNATTWRLQDLLRDAMTPDEAAGALELPGLAVASSVAARPGSSPTPEATITEAPLPRSTTDVSQLSNAYRGGILPAMANPAPLRRRDQEGAAQRRGRAARPLRVEYRVECLGTRTRRVALLQELAASR